jgi:hypothetical protein
MLQVLSSSSLLRFFVFSIINISFLYYLKNEVPFIQSSIFYSVFAIAYFFYFIIYYFFKNNKNFIFIAISIMFFIKSIAIFSLLYWIDYKKMPYNENSKVGFLGITLFVFIYLELYFFNKKKI